MYCNKYCLLFKNGNTLKSIFPNKEVYNFQCELGQHESLNNTVNFDLLHSQEIAEFFLYFQLISLLLYHIEMAPEYFVCDCSISHAAYFPKDSSTFL